MKKHPFTSYPAAKHPKHHKLVVTDIRENQYTFLLTPYRMGVNSSSCNNFANLGSFAKVSVSVESINPLLH